MMYEDDWERCCYGKYEDYDDDFLYVNETLPLDEDGIDCRVSVRCTRQCKGHVAKTHTSDEEFYYGEWKTEIESIEFYTEDEDGIEVTEEVKLKAEKKAKELAVLEAMQN